MSSRLRSGERSALACTTEHNIIEAGNDPHGAVRETYHGLPDQKRSSLDLLIARHASRRSCKWIKSKAKSEAALSDKKRP